MIHEIELFCGTKSFSKSAAAVGMKTETLDNDPRFQPTYLMSIMDFLKYFKSCNMIEGTDARYNVLWASPPCRCFSKMSAKVHWQKSRIPAPPGKVFYEPKTERAREAISIIKETALVIATMKPDFWFVENPVGMLRFFLPDILRAYGIDVFERRTVTYCQYGESYQKPTDIWTNFAAWKPRKACEAGASCHERVRAGSNAGTVRLKTNVHRAVVPKQLCDEIAAALKDTLNKRGIK